jgi:DNA polymerase III epsilon subunit-like protein
MRFARWEALLAGLEDPLIFYDLETTHMQPDLAVPIEFGIAVYGPPSLLPEGTEDDEETATARKAALAPGLLYASSMRVNPGPKVLASGAFQRASKIHGITAADLIDATPNVNDLQDTAASVLAGGTVCGFNSAEYDDAVLWPGCPNHALRTRIDVLRVVRAVLAVSPTPEVEGQDNDPANPSAVLPCFEIGTEHFRETLSALSVCLLGVSHKDAHGALPDCLRTADILAALMELWPITCPGTLAGLQALTRHPDGDKPPALRLWDGWDRFFKRDTPEDEWIFRVGKHRGSALGEADRGYLQWMISKGDFGEDTKAIVRAHLDQRR